MKISAYLLLFFCFSSQETLAQLLFFSEYWNQTFYRKTNYSDVAPQPVEDFVLTINSQRIGGRYYLLGKGQQSNWKIGLDGFGKLEFVYDFNNSAPRHDNIFNNHFKYSAGTRVRFQGERLIQRWLRYIQIDVYSEYQRMEAAVDKVKYWMDLLETWNLKSGINIWANGERQDKDYFNYELYFDLSHHTTNFSDPGNKNYLILTLSPRIYYALGPVDLYLNEEIVVDFLNRGNWNRNPFSNNLKSVFGSRFTISPFNSKDTVLRYASFLIFAEYSRIHYLDDVSKWPFQTELADHDIRAGFIIWWPIGEARYQPIGQNPN